MSEEDWFERALSEDDEAAHDGPESDAEGSDRSEDGTDPSEDASDRSAGGSESDGSDSADSEPDGSGEAAVEFEATADDGDSAAHSPEDRVDRPAEADDETVAEELEDGDGLFDEGFAEALEGAQSDPAGGLESGEFDQAGDAGSFGGGTESSSGFGGGPGGGDGADAGGFGGGTDAGGFGGGTDAGGFDPSSGFDGLGGGSDVPDDEELDSDIPRIDLGIEGLDEMIQGGVPERTLMVAIGSAGTGKTTFGLQFLNHGLERGENCVYITLEETDERVVRSATEKGFAFDEYVADGSLAVVDLDPVEMATSLQTIGGELPRLVEAFDAERLVLDSVSLLEMMYDDRAQRRNEIYDFTTALKESGVTTMLTSEASDDSPYVSRHGIVEYLTDAVFVLQYVRPSDFRETRLAIEIQKIRDANHSRETKPYEITDEGIDVYRQANLF